MTINDTKIKYLSVADNIYKVTNIGFGNLSIDAIQTDFTFKDVSGDALWDISYFGEYKIKLVNSGSTAKVIGFEGWKKMI